MGLFDFFKKQVKNVESKNEKSHISKCDEIIEGIPFGYKNSWFVFKNPDFNAIQKRLKNELDYISTLDFEKGLKEGWGGYFALLRPINQFTILISSNGGNFLEIAKEISKELGIIEYYMTHRSSNLIALTRFEFGITKREFVVSGDSGVITNEGTPTEIEIKIAERERMLSIKEANKDDVEFYKKQELLSFLGDEEHLMEIAENWSINPSKLNDYKVNNCVEIFDLKK
jgi:hypothetical protein